MNLREVSQVDENVMLIDFDIILGEVYNANYIDGGNLVIISPWIGDVTYYIGCCGFFSNLPLIFGDYLSLSDLIDEILKNKKSNVQIVTQEPCKNKYKTLSKQFKENELNFLIERAKNGAKIYSSSSKNGILHLKMILGSYGVVYGSFNITHSGRYLNIEDGNFAPSTSAVYSEKKNRCDEIITDDSEQLTVESLEKLKKSLKMD